MDKWENQNIYMWISIALINELFNYYRFDKMVHDG